MVRIRILRRNSKNFAIQGLRFGKMTAAMDLQRKRQGIGKAQLRDLLTFMIEFVCDIWMHKDTYIYAVFDGTGRSVEEAGVLFIFLVPSDDALDGFATLDRSYIVFRDLRIGNIIPQSVTVDTRD